MPLTYTIPPTEGPSPLANDAFYRGDLSYSYHGQQILQTLYYRAALGILPPGLVNAGADELAVAIRDAVWLGGVRDAMPTEAVLETIVVTPYNGTFDLINNLPYTLTVNQAGLATGNTAGPSACITCAFNMEPQVTGVQGWFPPKRGFISFGPYREGDVDNNGRLNSIAQAFYAQKLAKFAIDLEGLNLGVPFYPCRISTTRISDILTLRGFTDVSGVTIRDVQSFRASRKPEA